jgi:hypothetical protein
MKQDFIRSDKNPGAILNTDSSGLAAYRRNREIMRNVGTHEERIKKIENSIDDIKNMLIKVLESKDK